MARGTVTDAAGDPVSGARVFVDGEDRLVETDEDGGYALPEVPEGATVVFKMPGFRIHELPVTDGATVDVGLEPFEARASTRRRRSSRPPDAWTRCSRSSIGPRRTRWSSM